MVLFSCQLHTTLKGRCLPEFSPTIGLLTVACLSGSKNEKECCLVSTRPAVENANVFDIAFLEICIIDFQKTIDYFSMGRLSSPTLKG